MVILRIKLRMSESTWQLRPWNFSYKKMPLLRLEVSRVVLIHSPCYPGLPEIPHAFQICENICCMHTIYNLKQWLYLLCRYTLSILFGLRKSNIFIFYCNKGLGNFLNTARHCRLGSDGPHFICNYCLIWPFAKDLQGNHNFCWFLDGMTSRPSQVWAQNFYKSDGEAFWQPNRNYYIIINHYIVFKSGT